MATMLILSAVEITIHAPFVFYFEMICWNVIANIMIPIPTSGADQLWAIPTNITTKYDVFSVKHAKTLLYSFPQIQFHIPPVLVE